MAILDLAVVGRPFLFEGDVEQAKFGDDRAALVAEEWIGNAMRVGETRQRVDGVIAQCIDGNGVVALFECSLQLDQLRSAPWSPVCTSMDDE